MKKSIVFVILISFVLIAENALCGKTKGQVCKLKRVEVADAYKSKVLGLFIGIKEFNDPFWHNLEYPKKDVQDMVHFFENNKSLKLDYKQVLTNPLETNRDYILNNALPEFKLKNSSEKDVVFVYFSGHGTLTKDIFSFLEDGEKRSEPRKRPFIVTSDTMEENVEETAIALNQFIDWFEKLKSRRKVLVLDMCHSGIGKSQISPEQAGMIYSAKSINFEPIKDSWASIILSSCHMGGTSYEDKKLGNSVYTHFLIQGMQNGDLNGDGAVSISEAHNYSIEKTRQYTFENKGYKQIPTAYSKVLGKDPILVYGAHANTGSPTLFSYSSVNRGIEIFVDKAYSGMLPKGIAVKPGDHMIECKHGDKTIYKEKISFLPSYEYMLPDFSKKRMEKNAFIISEGGYRTYSRDDVPDDLVPNSPTGGFSVHYNGFKTRWLGLSGGCDYTANGDLEQFSTRIGLKYTIHMDSTRFFIGPDFMYLSLRYNSDKIGGKTVDENMSFFCPGAEALFTYTTKNNLVMAIGAKSHYVPYELNSEKNTILSSQFYLAIGYAF